MSYPSRLFGKIHFLLLAIFLLLSICIVMNQIMYNLIPDFYFEYLSGFDQVILTYENDILIIAMISFLIWLLRVHSALRKIAPQYPINEVEYLLRMMLPLVSFWGIASTFNQMSKYFAHNPSIGIKAIRIKVVVVFIYIFLFLLIPFKLIAVELWGGMLITYIILVGYMLMYVVFLLTTYWINQYVFMCVHNAPLHDLLQAPVPQSTVLVLPTRTVELSAQKIDYPIVQAHIRARFAAKLIELGVFVLITIAAIVLGAMSDNDNQMIIYISVTWLAWVVYLAIHLTINGQTIGKWMMKLKIVRAETGAEGGFIHNVLLRWGTNLLLGILVPFYSIVDVMFIFSRDARCIHDWIANTRVIRISK